MEDDDLASILDGDDPIEVDPTQGFHPDQLEADPVMKISPRLYAVRIEGVTKNHTTSDFILVDASEMDAYSVNDNPSAWEFSNSEVYYVIPSDKESTPRPLQRPDKDHSTVRGEGLLEYQDFDQYDFEVPGRTPSTVLSIGRDSEYGVGEIARKTRENDEAIVEIKSMV